ncbi:hypothetical protein CEXT_537281 [Caerostris extrusa]|uniref:Uncharacterized protein n=1 Tax=Caerostris extrusa TaxID=172846 RepID=A0AAV4S1Z7_CAEEX|nr:hypothetical protein CEXT_537281 [Caerostris extrusa]
MADIFQQELDSTEGQETNNESECVNENVESKSEKNGDADFEVTNSGSDEVYIDFENFFLGELEDLANSDYIHDR